MPAICVYVGSWVGVWVSELVWVWLWVAGQMNILLRKTISLYNLLLLFDDRCIYLGWASDRTHPVNTRWSCGERSQWGHPDEKTLPWHAQVSIAISSCYYNVSTRFTYCKNTSSIKELFKKVWSGSQT